MPLWWNRTLHEGVMLPVSRTFESIPLLTGPLMTLFVLLHSHSGPEALSDVPLSSSLTSSLSISLSLTVLCQGCSKEVLVFWVGNFWIRLFRIVLDI